jgi:hypothetical protein
MDYKNRIIELTPQEQHDLDCDNFGDEQLDEVIADTELLLILKTTRLNAENARRLGGIGLRRANENQVYDPQIFRLRTTLHQLEIVRLERDANASLK